MDPTRKQRYLEAVDLLVRGRAVDAVASLRALFDEDSDEIPELRLALGKAYLEAGDPERARDCFEQILAGPQVSPPAYVALLAAAASAAARDPARALHWLSRTAVHDPRFEHATRALKRRIEDGRPPLIRF